MGEGIVSAALYDLLKMVTVNIKRAMRRGKVSLRLDDTQVTVRELEAMLRRPDKDAPDKDVPSKDVSGKDDPGRCDPASDEKPGPSGPRKG